MHPSLGRRSSGWPPFSPPLVQHVRPWKRRYARGTDVFVPVVAI